MFKGKLIKVVISLSVLIVLAGCNSHAEKKQQAQIRWEKATARAKVPVALDMFDTGRTDEAYKLISMCLSVDPELPEAHLLLGRIHYSEGRYAQARKSFELAAKYDKKLDQAWYWLASVSQKDQNHRQALEYYNKALDLKPAAVDYIVAIADVYIREDNYEKAMGFLEDKAELMPGNTDLRLVRAEMMLRQGKVKDAIEMYNQALMLKGEDAGILEALGYCYVIDRNWDEATRTFEEMLVLVGGEKQKTCLEALAMCTMNNGEYGRALLYYDRLSLHDRDDPELWLKMGQTALGAESPARAFACATRALSLRPRWADAIALKGCSRYLSGDYKEALKIFEKITSHKKVGGFAWLMTGRCYKQLGKSDLCEKAYQNAARLNPDSMLVALLISSEYD